jgi:hypothetical protein
MSEFRGVDMSVGNEEQEWRRLATEVRSRLRELVRDPAEAAALGRDIDYALGLASGPAAKRELRRVLTRLPEIRDWLRRQEREDSYRAVPATPVRYLEVSVHENVRVGQRVPMFVRIIRRASERTTELQPLDVPPEGARVLISVWAPTLVITDDLEQELTVPEQDDSAPVRFGLIAPTIGLHTVVVHAYRGGTFLGETAVQITADAKVGWQEETVRTAGIDSMDAVPGEVTLQVNGGHDGYHFQLLSHDVWYEPESLRRRAGDPTEIADRLATELRLLAKGEADLDSPTPVRRRLKAMGVELWGDVVPEKVRDQFWDQADRITSFTIASEFDTVPWELLHPRDGDRDDGFLVQRVPVVRRLYGQRRAPLLAVTGARYIVPKPRGGSDDVDAAGEIEAIRERLGGVEDAIVEELRELLELLDDDPAGILHFAGHHGFSPEKGGAIRLNGGEFRPVDVFEGTWHNSPLVFFNGCRTAGEIPNITTNTGWARKFMRAGAGAFIGSLWAVRSHSATRFADAFYDHFYQRKQTLGRAALAARWAVKEEAGDPTWLAYTVYGHPAATVAGR